MRNNGSLNPADFVLELVLANRQFGDAVLEIAREPAFHSGSVRCQATRAPTLEGHSDLLRRGHDRQPPHRPMERTPGQVKGVTQCQPQQPLQRLVVSPRPRAVSPLVAHLRAGESAVCIVARLVSGTA